MDIKDAYLHGAIGVVKSINVNADKLIYTLADQANTPKEVTMPLATQSANGLLSSTDKIKLDNLSTTLGNYVTIDTDQTITGTKTFTKQLNFTATLGIAPFLVYSTTKVANLNADYVDGNKPQWGNVYSDSKSVTIQEVQKIWYLKIKLKRWAHPNRIMISGNYNNRTDKATLEFSGFDKGYIYRNSVLNSGNIIGICYKTVSDTVEQAWILYLKLREIDDKDANSPSTKATYTVYLDTLLDDFEISASTTAPDLGTGVTWDETDTTNRQILINKGTLIGNVVGNVIGNASTASSVNWSNVVDKPDMSKYVTLDTDLTVSGKKTFSNSIILNTDSTGIYLYGKCGIEKWSGYGPSLVAESGTDFWISDKSDRAIRYKILHVGNYSNTLDTRYYTETEVNNLISGANTYTDTKIANLVNSAPDTLDTLGEIAKYLQDSTVVGGLLDGLSKKVNKAGDVMTGLLEIPGYLRITQESGVLNIVIGNQNGNGVNKPAIIAGANGQLYFGYGNSWEGSGGTRTTVFNVSIGATITHGESKILDSSNYGVRLLGSGSAGWLQFGSTVSTNEQVGKISGFGGVLLTTLTVYSSQTKFLGTISINNTKNSWVGGMTKAAIMYDNYTALDTSKYHPILGVKTNGENVVNLGAYINDVGFYGYKKGRTENNYDWRFVFNSENGAITHSGTSITANKFITKDGTSALFVKGDGSLDSNTYALSSSLGDYVTLTTTQTISGSKTFTNTLTTRSITPESSNTYSLGTSSKKWANLYSTNIYSTAIYNGTTIYASNKEIIHADSSYFELNKDYPDSIMWLNASEYKFKLGSDGVQFMIAANGNVGIGDVGGAPAYKLHIGGGDLMADTVHAWSGGFKKNGSSDSYVLLGGGGHKAVSAFATASSVVTSLGTSGNYVTWTKNGTTNNLTVPYATKAAKLIDKSYGDSSEIDWSHVLWTQTGTEEAGVEGMKYSALLNVGTDLFRGWQIWNNRNVHKLYWRPAKADGSAWADVHTLLDNINTHITDGVITINGTTITPLTLHLSLSNYYTKTESDNKFSYGLNIDSIQLTNHSAAGWIRIAETTHYVSSGIISIMHGYNHNATTGVTFSFNCGYANNTDPDIVQLSGNGNIFTKVRIIKATGSATTAEKAISYIEVYYNTSNRNAISLRLTNAMNCKLLSTYTVGSVPTNYLEYVLDLIDKGIRANNVKANNVQANSVQTNSVVINDVENGISWPIGSTKADTPPVGLSVWSAYGTNECGAPTAYEVVLNVRSNYLMQLSCTATGTNPNSGTLRFRNGTNKDWTTVLASNNTYINNGVITINGISITPLTLNQSVTNVAGESGTVDASRHVWFSDSVTETKRNYDDDFMYNPYTNLLTVGSITGSAAQLTSTNIVSDKKFTNLTSSSWVDTGYTFTNLATGTYTVQVTSTNLVASGIMSVYKNLSDTTGDEIPLHVYGTAGWRPYLRTHANKLLISSNDATAATNGRTVTIKIARII